MNNDLFIVAEAGTIHDGNIELAKRLIDEAKRAGANAVKFQCWTESFVPEESEHYQFFEDRKFNEEQWGDLMAHANRVGIEMFASVFDIEAVRLMHKLGAKRFKVASRSAGDKPLLEYLLSLKLPIYISDGMNLGGADLQAWVSQNKAQVTMFHCVSEYPTAPEKAAISKIDYYRLQFGDPVGYSDHTEGTLGPLAGVARGALIIEKHFRCAGCSPKHPDFVCALATDDFAFMVATSHRVRGLL